MTSTAKIIRIFLVLLGVMVLAMILPDLYRKNFEKRPGKKLIYYSEISKDFIICEDFSDTLTHETNMIYYNREGKLYTEREYNRLLPFLFTRKLALSGELPDSVNGVKFDQQLVKTTKRGILMPVRSFTFQLNPLFESQSGKVRPELPDDLFRINSKGIEFIDAATNRVLKDKSRLFNDALIATGFQAPAKAVYGIPSTLKSRDDGYFIIDNRGGLYHLKMIEGQPYCRHITDDLDIHSLKCQVPGDIYAYIFDREYQLYILKTDYSIKKLPIRPTNGQFMISGNCFYKSFKNTDSDSIRMYVLDGNYDPVDYYALEADNYSKSRAAQTGHYLFPFRLMLTPGYTHLIPIYHPFCRFIGLNLLLALLLAGIKYYHHRKMTDIFNILDLLTVILTGIFGFIAVLIFPNRK